MVNLVPILSALNFLMYTNLYLLNNFLNKFEQVSYNAAGVLSHLASDGPEKWSVEEPSRDEVLARMVAAIDRWNLSADRNINYRSFEPILQLAKISHTPQCQHWAVWALANLTTVYGESNITCNIHLSKMFPSYI
jgi:Zyg-11 family protein